MILSPSNSNALAGNGPRCKQEFLKVPASWGWVGGGGLSVAEVGGPQALMRKAGGLTSGGAGPLAEEGADLRLLGFEKR